MPFNLPNETGLLSPALQMRTLRWRQAPGHSESEQKQDWNLGCLISKFTGFTTSWRNWCEKPTAEMQISWLLLSWWCDGGAITSKMYSQSHSSSWVCILKEVNSSEQMAFPSRSSPVLLQPRATLKKAWACKRKCPHSSCSWHSETSFPQAGGFPLKTWVRQRMGEKEPSIMAFVAYLLLF